jgi:hypothetical protein
MISPLWRRCAREMMMCDQHVGRHLSGVMAAIIFPDPGGREFGVWRSLIRLSVLPWAA